MARFYQFADKGRFRCNGITPCVSLAMGALLWGSAPAQPQADLPADQPPGALTAQEQKRVNKAIEAGIDFLRRTQFPDGSWNDAKVARNDPVGFTALPALALLESGVRADDEVIQRAAQFVRLRAPGATQTYGISLAVLFLNRLVLCHTWNEG